MKFGEIAPSGLGDVLKKTVDRSLTLDGWINNRHLMITKAYLELMAKGFKIILIYFPNVLCRAGY